MDRRQFTVVSLGTAVALLVKFVSGESNAATPPEKDDKPSATPPTHKKSSAPERAAEPTNPPNPDPGYKKAKKEGEKEEKDEKDEKQKPNP